MRLRRVGAVSHDGAAVERRRIAAPWRSRTSALSAERLDVALQDRRLRQARQALPYAPCPCLADAVHRLEVVDARGEELLEAAEVLDQAVDDRAREARNLGQEAEAAGGDRRVE